ncbi:MAG: bifunctional nuclease family protein [Candidatus Omnitrophota bacterium]|nr:bifunctional nuclease family protein [Candidatus Omnitrophota bacterium]
MVEMELSKIIIDEKRHDQVIVLKEKSGGRLLPIVIGITEAAAIKMQLAGVYPPRPMTHDLLKTILEDLDAHVDKIIIDKLEENTFHAKIVITLEGKVKIIDSRPSDSIALAVRTKSPIFVEDEVLNKANPFGEVDIHDDPSS